VHKQLEGDGVAEGVGGIREGVGVAEGVGGGREGEGVVLMVGVMEAEGVGSKATITTLSMTISTFSSNSATISKAPTLVKSHPLPVGTKEA